MILDHEEEFGKSTLSMQLRFYLSGFNGYEHYRPTKENFFEFFKKNY